MDGFGDEWSGPTRFCTCPVGFAPNNQDCHDGNPDVNPNAVFHSVQDAVEMYSPDPRDTSPDGWDWNCNDVDDMSSVPPFTIAAGCFVGGQAGCTPACSQAMTTTFVTIPCGGRLGQTACAAMGCGIPGAPGCGGVGIGTTPQGCR
jgi:hypothetical protein